MTYEEAKEELKSYLHNLDRINLIELDAEKPYKTTTTLSHTHFKSSIKDTKAENIVNSINEEPELKRLKEENKKIEDKINKIYQPYSNILKSIYISGHSEWATAHILKCSISTIKRNKKEGIKLYANLENDTI